MQKLQKFYAILHFENKKGVKMWNPNQSINNLYNSCDPRDQLAHDIRSYSSGFQSFNSGAIQLGMSPQEKFLKQRQGQIDCRDQEWQDIQMHLSTQFLYKV